MIKHNSYQLLKLIFPLVITGLIQSAVWFFETIFLSHLSPNILAAGSLVTWAFGTVFVIIFGTLSSINILIAHKFGAEDEEGILHVVRDGFWLALLFAIPVFLLFWNMAPLFLLLGQSPEVVVLANAYLHAMAWGALANVIIIALLEVYIGLGNARMILIFNVLCASLTIVFSYAFIFGRFSFPQLGIAGAGWGMTLSNWITVSIMGGYALTNKKCQGYFRYLLHFGQQSYFKELILVGAPMGLMYCIEVAFFFALTLVMGSYGSLVLAANQIALQYLGVVMGVTFSTAQAITVRMGHLLGAGEKAAAAQTAYLGFLFATLFILIVAICYWCFPTYLIALDFDIKQAKNAEIVYFATQFLAVCAVFQIFDTMRISLFGALRSLKDTRFTLFISIFSFWGIALPFGYFLAEKSRLHEVGLWWGMTLASGISVVLLLKRFQSKIKEAKFGT